MKLAVVGATGLVGQVMLKVLEERRFPFTELYPVASERSIGKKVKCMGKEYSVISMGDAISRKPDIALFSAGGSISTEYAPKFADVGCIVIDNSSAWRMDPGKKLIVPEINGHVLTIDDRIIANPNCSTIQMVLPLSPLHDKYRIKRIVVSTYQSVTGTGKEAVDQMMAERENKPVKMVYPYKIDMNVLPHIDVFQENGYTKEEMKMVNETKKILGDPSVQVTATCVRIPTVGGHSESVNIEFSRDFDINEVKELIGTTKGVVLEDDPKQNKYPMPINSHNKDEVFVGRIRRDETQPNTLNMWIVAHNPRQGAATNALHLAEYLNQKGLIF
jgi:aspartate-semialdehyde dehydrogenase